MSCPATTAVPELAGSKVVNIRMVVVLPAPFDPSRPKIVPVAMLKSIASTATSASNRRVTGGRRRGQHVLRRSGFQLFRHATFHVGACAPRSQRLASDEGGARRTGVLSGGVAGYVGIYPTRGASPKLLSAIDATTSSRAGSTR